MKLLALTLSAVLCAVLLQQATALKCVDCYYEITAKIPLGTKACDDPFVSGNTTECAAGESCFISKRNTSLVITRDYTLKRGCKKDCKDITKAHGYTTCCTEDLCNSSVTYSSSTAASCLVLMLATLFAYYY